MQTKKNATLIWLNFGIRKLRQGQNTGDLADMSLRNMGIGRTRTGESVIFEADCMQTDEMFETC